MVCMYVSDFAWLKFYVKSTFYWLCICVQEDYNVSLYSAHLEALYKGLLVHLDDPEARIQDAVLGKEDQLFFVSYVCSD